MYCPKCGTQNVEHAQICISCGQILTAAAPAAVPVQVKMSGLAIAAFILGILSLFTLGLTAIPAIILGIIALSAIGRSGGRLTGSAFAVIGIGLPVLSFFAVLLVGILMPALARTRQLAFRMTCGTNLSDIGKAMLIYAGDYDEELPRAGGLQSTWGPVGWDATSRYSAYNVDAKGNGGTANISSCFYLLVKYAEVTPKSFVCKGDTGTNEFKMQDVAGAGSMLELIDLWNFGPDAWKCCSYSYHVPFGQYFLTPSCDPGLAVAADRNPFIKSPAADPADYARFQPDAMGYTGTGTSARIGNAIAHQGDGQNVLFLDLHVEFAKRAWCSVEDDNIYLISERSDGKGSIRGNMPVPPNVVPVNRMDSILVHDPDTLMRRTTRPTRPGR